MIDALFRDAQLLTKEQPSEDVWEKISADLDKHDMQLYPSHRYIWKRLAIVLLLILTSMLLHETKVNLPALPSNGIIPHRKLTPENGSEPSSVGITPKNRQAAESTSTSTTLRSLTGIIDHSAALLTVRLPLKTINEKAAIQTTSSPPADTILATASNENFNSYLLHVNPAPLLPNLDVPLSINPLTLRKPSIVIKNMMGKNTWWMNPFFSLDMARYRLHNDLGSTGLDDEKSQILSREQHEFSFSTGIMFEKTFANKIHIKTGLYYSRTSISIAPQLLYASIAENKVMFKYVASSGYGYFSPVSGSTATPGDSLMCTEAEHSVESISLPLMMGYQFRNNKINIVPSAGVFLGFITKANLKTEITQANKKEQIYIERLHGMKDAYLGLIADVNINYSINRRLYIHITPNLKYAMTSITTNNVVKTFPYSLGLSGGIMLGL